MRCHPASVWNFALYLASLSPKKAVLTGPGALSGLDGKVQLAWDFSCLCLGAALLTF